MGGSRSSASTLTAIVALEGALMVAGGAVAWVVAGRELAKERITVESDAGMLAGRKVAGPLSAYAEARIIDQHAREATGGRTFAELPGDDPNREMAKTASLMRASLFTSVMAFGVSAMSMALGAALIVVARAMRSSTKQA